MRASDLTAQNAVVDQYDWIVDRFEDLADRAAKAGCLDEALDRDAVAQWVRRSRRNELDDPTPEGLRR
jgi:hypothetical protein